MARRTKASRRAKRRRSVDWAALIRSRLLSEIWGILVLVAAALLLLSLVTHAPTDPTFLGPARADGRVSNLVGGMGANVSEAAFQFFGFCAYLLPFFVGWSGWKRFWTPGGPPHPLRGMGLVLLVLALASLLSLTLAERRIGGIPYDAGGWLGAGLASFLSGYLHPLGAGVLSLGLVAVGALIATRLSLAEFLSRVRGLLQDATGKVIVTWVRHREMKRKEALRSEVIRKHAATHREPVGSKTAPSRTPAEEAPSTPSRPIPRAETKRPSGLRQSPLPFTVTASGYVPPPLSLLNDTKEEHAVDDRHLMETAKLLTSKFQEFQVVGQVVQIHPGPVVTTFEFKPDAGVKYSKITSLSDDLCLAIQAESARIDRISGKSTVGIEVPNKMREIIALRELLAWDKFVQSPSKLTLALGKRIHGEPFVADLARMPHLLIAGATGAGKSVCLNAMINSILYKASPEEVKFILIDTKRLELGIYEQTPHLLTPVVTDPKQASNALKWATTEMERRYRQLAEAGVRNIDQFNSLIALSRKEKKPLTTSIATADGRTREEEVPPLPFIVIVIDELADLIMTAAADIEESITRLAQMARAVGIHLILSTQRPSVDIITGVIKANFPSRIAFRVSSKVDSRTILDTNGAEQLLGHGDMLFLPPGSSRLIRLHGPLMTEMEANRVISYLRRQGKPRYNAEVTKGATSQGGNLDEEVDVMYDQAARLVVQTGQASISHLQRRLRLGYARAARLVDMMERDGLVGPGEGAKPREILVGTNYFEELEQHRRSTEPDA